MAEDEEAGCGVEGRHPANISSIAQYASARV